jgi:hypothetical protein
MSDYDLIETVLIDDLPERCLKCDRSKLKPKYLIEVEFFVSNVIIIV